MGSDAMILVFWMLSFKPTFSLSSFTFIKRLFSSSSISAIRVGSSAYLRLLIILPAILIPACASSSPAFLMMYSAYKLNKQGDNIQPWRTPFPIWPILKCFIEHSTTTGGWMLKFAEISEEPIHLGREWGKREKEKHLNITSDPRWSEICLKGYSQPCTSGSHMCWRLCLISWSPEV